MEKVNIILDSTKAKEPQYATDGSGCFDIYCIEDGFVTKENSIVFDTGLKFEVPKDHTLFIFSRSGHGFNNGVRLANCVGVIDSDYRGRLMVKLVCDDKARFLKAGEAVAQGCILYTPQVKFNVVQELSNTERGQNGFGSTDLKTN